VAGGVATLALLAGGIWAWNSRRDTTPVAENQQARIDAGRPAEAPKVPQNPVPPVEVVQQKPSPSPDGPAPSALSASDLQRVKRATAYLRVQMPGGGVSQGSGFFAVERGVLLTNAHVLGMLRSDARPPQHVQVLCSSGEKDERAFTADVLGVDRGSDLAVLRVRGDNLPDPLEVKSAKTLTELQKVYVFGFPFGDQLGKNITVSESSVSSLRKNPDLDIIVKIQVNGGMQPGNSGGPLVDTRGHVVGVAVSIIHGTQINFAIPGDQVHTILNGRIAGSAIHQPYREGQEVKVDVSLSLIDPLRKMKATGYECWTGNPGKPRPPTREKPAPLPGDSEVREVALTPDGRGGSAGQVLLPALPPGKMHWLRPWYVNGAGEKIWVAAQTYNPLPPMELKPVELVLRASPGVKPLRLTSKSSIKLVDDRSEHSLAVNMDVDLQEQTLPAKAEGTPIFIRYQRAQMGVTLDGKPAPRSARLQTLLKGLVSVVTRLLMDPSGTVRKDGIQAPRLPPRDRADVLDLHEQISQSLEAVAIPLPNRTLQARESWTELRPLPLEVVDKADAAVLEMTYTYEGTRTRNGRQESAIRVSGTLKGVQGQELRFGGRADGRAVYDVALGRVTISSLTVTFDMNAARGIRAVGTLEVRMDRK
jgi:S1-C subfamily serine protease